MNPQKNMGTIAVTVQNGLCTGCGTCVGICPTEAIDICLSDSDGLYFPKIDEGKCTKCGLCLRCCAGHSVKLGSLNRGVFGKESEDYLLGNYQCCYVGHSNDSVVRCNSSSGGIASHLAIYALEKGLVDGVLVVRMKEDQPLIPEAFVAKTRQDILSASKSKYCPVPLNIALRKILRTEGKFAVVGLPCHIHGIRLAEKNVRGLKDKIVLHIGLLCSHTTSFKGTDFLLDKIGIRKEAIARLDYRGKGWPGFMSIRLKSGTNHDIRFIKSWNAYWNVFSPFFFTPLRCMMCPDQANELSDISVGDAWLPELKENAVGESVIIARTKVGEEVLAAMVCSRLLSVKQVSAEKIKQSQAFSLNFKKNLLQCRLSTLRMLGKPIPQVDSGPPGGFPARMDAIMTYLSFHVSMEMNSKLLRYVPLPIFRLYFGIFKCFSLLS
jgi:coenzyme F420 hydrogenase subunit beta